MKHELLDHGWLKRKVNTVDRNNEADLENFLKNCPDENLVDFESNDTDLDPNYAIVS